MLLQRAVDPHHRRLQWQTAVNATFAMSLQATRIPI